MAAVTGTSSPVLVIAGSLFWDQPDAVICSSGSWKKSGANTILLYGAMSSCLSTSTCCLPAEKRNPVAGHAVLKQRVSRRCRKRSRPTNQTRLWAEQSFPVFWQRRYLRFQCFSRPQACGKAALHASQSGEARAGNIAGIVAMEQLPVLLAGRGRRVEGWTLNTPPFAAKQNQQRALPQRMGHPRVS